MEIRHNALAKGSLTSQPLARPSIRPPKIPLLFARPCRPYDQDLRDRRRPGELIGDVRASRVRHALGDIHVIMHDEIGRRPCLLERLRLEDIANADMSVVLDRKLRPPLAGVG